MSLTHSIEELKKQPEKYLGIDDKFRIIAVDFITSPKEAWEKSDPAPTIILGPPIILIGLLTEGLSRIRRSLP